MEAELMRHDGWAELILNRPERRNAITGGLGRALADHLETVAAATDIQAVLLRGAGGAFCSGLDLKAFNEEPPPDWLPEFPDIWRRVHRGLFDCPVPIVGALERYAINGGAALALACDLLVAGDGAFLEVGEVKLGMAAPYNLAWLALRFPETTAARLALTGERVHGEALARLGIATRITGDDAVLEDAQTLAATLAGYPEGATRTLKLRMRAHRDVSADAWFDRFTDARTPPRPPPGPSPIKR